MENGFLGRGFPFPLRIADGEIEPENGEAKIRQAIYVILMTRQGERPMLPEFGSRLWDYVFDLPGETCRHLLCSEIVQAVCRWEHRVDHVSAAVDDSELSRGKVILTVSYTVRATNRPDNLVFPFYLEEGGGR
ncbi:Gene 25-like lysozyme [Caprobacter fermentans]|uniref:GPW/gp25 family protein n=1 Tax=Caproicibacter fermentans TaxID=2576756 RepID=A0A6N8HV76_9FIRM|nr:GPW/gp25 family protein [Caproicibacter fermentans]MVB09373.1 Gene 25-like lysozyme [Caproicibacter fermentans]OCN02790.1 hypothetical protein A7X67_02740 [Clostridium sp. W14A]QNK40470.1 GPW/gp25 family protein [Caproicibacter fermentans]